jgi:hypothetical protein
MPIQVTKIRSEIWAVFDGDQNPVEEVFYRDGEEKLGKAFGFAEISSGTNQEGLPEWYARHGRLETTRVRAMVGNEHVLKVIIDGETENAQKVLEKTWSVLAGQEFVIEKCSKIFYQTTAIVKAEKSFYEVFPFLALSENFIDEFLKNKEQPSPQQMQPQFHLEIRSLFASKNISQQLVIAPRFNSTDKRLFFTRSPLPSPEHKTLVEKILTSST